MYFSNVESICFIVAFVVVGGSAAIDEVKWRLAKRRVNRFLREKEGVC